MFNVYKIAEHVRILPCKLLLHYYSMLQKHSKNTFENNLKIERNENVLYFF